MKRDEYFKRALELYDSGQVSGEVYDAMIMNAGAFCDDEEDGYSDFDNPEATTGAGFDDRNFRRYTLFSYLDKGIDDMEAGRMHEVDEAFQIIRKRLDEES